MTAFPTIGVSLPITNLGGTLDGDNQLSNRLIDEELFANRVIRAAIERSKIAGHYPYDMITVVSPVQLLLESALPNESGFHDIYRAFRVFQRDRLSEMLDCRIVINRSGDARSDGIAIEVSQACGAAQIPTAYIANFERERLSSNLRDYTKTGLSFFEAEDEFSVVAALSNFFDQHMVRVIANHRRRVAESPVFTVPTVDAAFRPITLRRRS